MTFIPKVSDRSVNKPIYLIIADDPTETDGLAYYKSKDLNEHSSLLEIRGFQLTKTQMQQLVKKPNANSASLGAVNCKIPWHRIIRIENVTYQKQGE